MTARWGLIAVSAAEVSAKQVDEQHRQDAQSGLHEFHAKQEARFR
jgi:hypothetical protein